MRGLFPHFADASQIDHPAIWKRATFVFDTNVLLNLYRYQAKTRDELVGILEKLGKQIWIPHHVALEFQRNRLLVIGEQLRRFAEVRRVVEKSYKDLCSEFDKLQLIKRHSSIDPEPLKAEFKKITDNFLQELSRLEEKQQKPTEQDVVRNRVEHLFEGRVGSPPRDQAALDEWYEQAKERFELQIPPGYDDAAKDNQGGASYVDGGMRYTRAYGDYVIWRQLLDHASESKIKAVVLVTDDAKADWWLKIDAAGTKTVGPRPELVDEARRVAGIESFLMYSPERFLTYAHDFLKAAVSEGTLEDVRQVSTARLTDLWKDSMLRAFAPQSLSLQARAQLAVEDWLIDRFGSVETNRTDFPDYLVHIGDGTERGFEVKCVRDVRLIVSRLRESLLRAELHLVGSPLAELTMIWVVLGRVDASETSRVVDAIRELRKPPRVGVLVAHFEDPLDGGLGLQFQLE